MGKRYVGGVLMTTAVLLRSGMKRNFHVPFWRAVGGATLSLTLIIAAAMVMLQYARGKELASSDVESPSSTLCGSMRQLGALKRQKLMAQRSSHE